MRTAKAIPVCFEMSCPKCKQPIPAPHGSHLWDLADWEKCSLLGATITCDCGEVSKLPAFKN